MDYSEVHKVNEWVTDVDEKYLTSGQAFYIKNREFFVNMYSKSMGHTIGKNTPLNANYETCNIETPAGENYAIGGYYSDLSNEFYAFVYNSNGINYIYRIDGKGDCTIVYDGCLEFSAEPENAITQFRVHLDIQKTCKNWKGKRLIWTDGTVVNSLDVEASISTNSFTTPFFDLCTTPCELVKLCVPNPCSCPKITPIPDTDKDNLLPNKLSDNGFQFMYRWHYYDGRKSDWSEVSSLFFQNTKGACFGSETSRCLSIEMGIGNAMVEYVEIAYRNTNENIWYRAELIEKYKQYSSPDEQWYERTLSDLITNNIDVNNCTFKYKFCNDKQCLAIDPTDTVRVFNPFPRNPQGFFPFKNVLAFYGYDSGNCPIPKKETDKFEVLIEETSIAQCQEDYVNVTIRAVIHNIEYKFNQFVHIGEDVETASTIVKWGGLDKTSFIGADYEDPIAYGQRFYGKHKNFIAYIEGTDLWGEMKQKEADAFLSNPIDYGVMTGIDQNVNQRSRRRKAKNGKFLYQEYTFKVKRGVSGFVRLQGHRETGINYNTSTQVVGLVPISAYKGDFDEYSLVKKEKEIYFNTCNLVGDKLVINDAFFISDNIVGLGSGLGRWNFDGYLKSCDNSPLHGIIYTNDNSIHNDIKGETDWNGFYHGLGDRLTSADIKFYGETSCVGTFTEIEVLNISVDNGLTTKDTRLLAVNPYCDNNYAIAEIKVKDCNGAAVSGQTIALSGSKSVKTNGLGVARFRIRNYEYRNRVLRAILMNKSGCISFDCNNVCSPCMPSAVSATPLCYHFTTTPKIINLQDLVINTKITERNEFLKSGGRYGIGFIVKGDCGNISFVNGTKYLDIPKKCNSNKILKYIYNFKDMKLPLWAKCITLVRTKNLNPFELQWIVDSVEYIDGKIKLTIQSLNDYNEKNFYQVNANYNYVEGDRLEIVADDNGKFFCESLNYQILSPFHDELVSNKTDAPANFFNQLLIEDDGRIGTEIKKGFIIEMQRPTECSNQETYYSICSTISVENGEIVNPDGFFTTFDTYIINRDLGNGLNRNFEHHSPSDFWGKRLSDVGKPYIVNKFENQIRKGRGITLSTTDFNSFGLFETEIGDAKLGDIVAMDIKDDKVILGICENDNFITQTADNLLRVDNQGNVVANSNEFIANPQVKIMGRYGCQKQHIGSIYFGDGYATWADVNSHSFIMHDYSKAEEVCYGKVGYWTKSKFQFIETYNRAATNPLDKYRFSTGENHINKIIMLTVKRLRESGIDNEFEPNISSNETIAFNPFDKKFYGNYSFTPEVYGRIDLFDYNGCAFLTLHHSQTYTHPIIPKKFNEFYGVAVDSVIGICLNKEPTKIKRGLSIEVQDELMWFLYKVTTDNKNFLSEIPPIRWKKREDKWNAEFLNNINSRGGLYANKNNFSHETARGYYLKCIFVRDNTNNLEYNSKNDSKRVLYDENDMFLFKFMLSESSGQTENL